MFASLPPYQSASLPPYQPTCLPASLSACLSLCCQLIQLPVGQPTSHPAYLSVCLPTFLQVCLYPCLPASLTVCLSFCCIVQVPACLSTSQCTCKPAHPKVKTLALFILIMTTMWKSSWWAGGHVGRWADGKTLHCTI
jgi:hypothetical protein